MKQYTVEITDDALEDLNEIYDYIANDLRSPENALKQYDRISERILNLETYPARYRLFDSEPEHSLGIHKMVVDNYLVCYVIDPEIVTVLAVFYGASDVHQRLQERF